MGPTREEARRQRDDDKAEAADLLDRHASWMDQSIMCLYFQSQQQSYMVNSYNKQNPDSPVVLDEEGHWDEHHHGDDDASDPHDDLSEYELARASTIERNNEMLRGLGLI